MRVTIEPETEEEARTATKKVYERLWAVGIAASRCSDKLLPEPPIYHSHGPVDEVYERCAGLMFKLIQWKPPTNER
jgi:hypothetical protein